MELYHRDKGFPEWFTAPTGRVKIAYGSHARKAANDDRYGRLRLLQSITLDRFAVIEIGVENGRVAKMLLRGTYDDTRDLCIVLMPSNRAWFCKTVWANLVSDTHKTIDYTRYLAP